MLLEVGRHLLFFDKDGNELNLTRTYGVWYGMLYFPRVSSNLHEVQHLFITEEVKFKETISQSINLSSLPVGYASSFVFSYAPDPSGETGSEKVYTPGRFINLSTPDGAATITAAVTGYNSVTGSLVARVVSKTGTGTHSTWESYSITHTFPRGDDNSYFTFQWRESESSENVFLFETDVSKETAIIRKMEELNVSLDNGASDDIEGVTFSGYVPIAVADDASLYRVISSADEVDTRVMQVNVALHGAEESRHARTLEIYYNNLVAASESVNASFSSPGTKNQSYYLDVPEEFDETSHEFEVSVAVPGSGTKLNSSSSLTLGSMSLSFTSSISNSKYKRLQEGGTILVVNSKVPSETYSCTVVYSEHDPNADETTVYVTDNPSLSLVQDITEFRILYRDSDLVPIAVASGPYSFPADANTVVMKREDANRISFVFAPSGGTYLPPSGSSIIIRYTELESSQKVAEIAFYGEIEGEDERFKVILENFGRDIVPDVSRVFRDSDTNEMLPDFKVINEKRKELLAAGEEIFPYMGSYRSFINAIKFFGYGDLRLKEYWKNIDLTSSLYGKYRHVDVPLDLSERNDDELIPSTSWKKTNRFSLYYDINRLTGDYDEFGQPITQDVFDFTNDEVLIKLFSLKNALKKYFLPLNARIVDITGEGIYFETYAFETWLTQNEMITASPEMLDIKFRVEPEIAYLEDLGTGLRTDAPLPGGATIVDATEYSVGDLGNYEVSSFCINKNKQRFLDESDVKVGAKVNLIAETFKVTWADLREKWKSMSSASSSFQASQYSWKNLSLGDAYEMEWRVNSVDRVNDFKYRIRGKMEDLKEHELTVPFEGPYDVALAYHLTISGSQSKIKRSAFQVLMKSSNIVGIYKASNIADEWNDLRGTWKNASYSWILPNKGVLRPVRRRRASNPTDNPSLFKRTTWQQSVIRWVDTAASTFIRDPEIVSISSAPIHYVDGASSTIILRGNYFNPDVPQSSTIKVGTVLKFIGPENREGFEVLSVDPQNGSISIRGEHPESSLSGKFLAIISRKEVTDLTFSALTLDLETESYRPVYSFDLPGDLTGVLRSGLGMEYMLATQSEYNEGLIRSCAFLSSSGKTRVVMASLDERTFNFDPSELESSTHLDELSGCRVRYFDYVSRLSAVTVMPYNGKTTVYLYDPSRSLSVAPDPSDPTSDIISYWANVSEGTSLMVKRASFDGEYTIAVLEDPLGSLNAIDSSYSVDFSEFDLDYAESLLGPHPVSTWKGLNASTWASAYSRTWGSFDFHATSICGFVIKNVAPGGSIRVDSGEAFEFPSNEMLTLEEAIKSLRESKIPGITKFDYSVALYEETLGLVRNIPYTISIEETDSYLSYSLGGTYFIVPLEAIDGDVVLSSCNAAKAIYVGLSGGSKPTFRIVSVGKMGADGTYSGRKLGSISLMDCVGSFCSSLQAQEAGSSNFNGVASTFAVSSFDGGIVPTEEDPYGSTYYGKWPYYIPQEYSFVDGYVLDADSSTGSASQKVVIPFSSDITEMRCFSIGEQFYIKSIDGSDSIDLVIESRATFDPILQKIIVPVEYSSEYASVVDPTDYRSFFLPWSEITNPISYDPVLNKEVYTEPEYVILAMARVPGTSGLCYLEYEGGVYGSDPEFPTRGNSYPLYNFREQRLTDDLGSYNPLDYAPTRGWQEGGFAFPPVKNIHECNDSLSRILRSKYGPYLNGSFSWSDTYIGYDHVDCPTLSTVYFSLANCKIAGAKDVIWTISDSRNDVVLSKTRGKNFAWTFKQEGNFNVSANVVDANDNSREIIKTGFVRVFDSYEKLEFEGCPID